MSRSSGESARNKREKAGLPSLTKFHRTTGLHPTWCCVKDDVRQQHNTRSVVVKGCANGAGHHSIADPDSPLSLSLSLTLGRMDGYAMVCMWQTRFSSSWVRIASFRPLGGCTAGNKRCRGKAVLREPNGVTRRRRRRVGSPDLSWES